MLVTGGTGYLGSHAVAALAGAGHRIRVLARSAEKVPAALGPLGVDGVQAAVGDVTEPAAVERARSPGATRWCTFALATSPTPRRTHVSRSRPLACLAFTPPPPSPY